MGFKSKQSLNSEQPSENNLYFRVGDVIFYSLDDYIFFKEINDDSKDILSRLKNHQMIESYFSKVKSIKVKYIHPMECDPCDELYVIFKNVGDMFINEQGGEHYTKEHKFGEMFFFKV